MTLLKRKAFDIAYGLYNRDAISGDDYAAIRDALEEIETLWDRDKVLEEMWHQFGDVPMDPETECMEEPFLGFPAGTDREDIWHWFDERHSKGVVYLLCRTDANSSKFRNLMLWKNDFIRSRDWEAICDALGISKETVEIEAKCLVCVAKKNYTHERENAVFDCESSTCQFNHGGECRFAMVHERKPRITDDDGCIDYDYQEGDL